MGQPSSPAPAAEPLESDRAPLTELIHLYQREQATLIAHQQEVERRRAAVRTAAEHEASEILLAARREIRRVLVRTRHELVALTAQVQAAGCEASPGQPHPPILGDDFQLSTARETRSVLRDARAELITLSRDAAGFWTPGDEARLPAPAIATVPLPERAAVDVSSLAPLASDRSADDYTEEVPSKGLVEKLIEYWRPAALSLAVLAVVGIMMVAARFSSRTQPPITEPKPVAAASTASAGAPAPAPQEAAPTSANPSRTASAAATTGAAPDQPASRPASIQPAKPRPPEQPAPTAVTRSSTGQQAPPAMPVAPRTAAETQTAAPNYVAPPAQDAAVAEREILERHQRWFEAFERGDRATMASIASDNFSLVDQRPEGAPTPAGGVARTIQDVRVRVTAGVGAVLSGRIADTAAADQSTVAMLSEVWIRQAEEWRLVSVRMVPLAAVATTLQ
jgi:hypothetical protein